MRGIFPGNLSFATNVIVFFRKEIDKAVGKKMKFDFDYYLLIAKTYQTKAENKAKSKNNFQRVFINTEEEIFFEVSQS